jgi:hypothetical protein
MALQDDALSVVQTFLGGVSSHTEPGTLKDMVEGAFTYFESETGCVISAPAESSTHVLEVYGERKVLIPPLSTVTQVEWATWPAQSTGWALIGSDYYIQQGRVLIFNIAREPGYLRLTLERGYDTFSAIPADVRWAILQIVGLK